MEKDNKIAKFKKEHEAIFQLILFTLLSCVAAAVEVTTFMLINNVFLKSLNSEPFKWFIFNYDGGVAGGLGTMVAFLASTTLAQIVSFVLNRKKTFNANNNVVFSAIMYVIMVVVIISTQTYFGPIWVTYLDSLIGNSGISSLLGKFSWMFLTFLIIFPMNKYVIMRNDKTKPAAV